MEVCYFYMYVKNKTWVSAIWLPPQALSKSQNIVLPHLSPAFSPFATIKKVIFKRKKILSGFFNFELCGIYEL